MSKEKIIAYIVGILLQRLTSDKAVVFVRKGIELARQEVLASKNKYDDILALPVLDLLDNMLSDPDDDETLIVK